MRIYYLSILILFNFVFIVPASAQLSNLGTNEFYVSDGLLSYDQFAGVFGNTTNAANFMSFPYSISGAAFLTYRHYFSKIVSMGITIGLDNQKGDLSYGRDGVMGYMGNNGYGPSGYYKREVYTGAAEIQVAYRTEYKYKVYGYFGAGYTSSKITINFFDNISAQNYFYGTPSSMFPRKNTTVDFSHFNTQITPIGFRSGGDFAKFIEFGFGYKGIISCGISYKFVSGKHKRPKLGIDTSNETLLLPYGYPIGGSLQYMAKVNAKRINYHKAGSFNKQMDNILSAVYENNGNVFRITDIFDPFENNCYIISGQAYFVANFDSFKNVLMTEKNKKFENGKCSYLIIYRPGYNYTNSGLINNGIIINDSISIEMRES